METTFILNQNVELENRRINVHVEDINPNTYIIKAPTTDIAGVVEYQLKKQSKEYIKVVTGGVLFAPYIIEDSSNKTIYFEFDGHKLTTYDETGINKILKNEDKIIRVLSRIERTEAKIFFRAKVITNVEDILEYMYGESVKFTHIPNEDTFEISSKSTHELSTIRRILLGSNVEFNEVHYGSTFNIPNVYAHSLERVIYFTLDENGMYMPLYTKEENNEVISKNVEFINSFVI